MKPDHTPRPPRLADRLLGWFCAPHLLEEVLGDLHEEFDYQVQRVGLRKARLRYWRDVLGFARPFAIKRKQTTSPQPLLFHFPMLQSYLTIALRTLWRSKGYTAINVGGLAVAFCVCLYLFLMVYHHFSYDSFHADGDRIFQSYVFANDPERATVAPEVPLPFAPALKSEFPEVEAVARMGKTVSGMEYRGKYFEKEITLTDPDFLKMFSFPMLKGNRQSALRTLGSLVISESTAHALFGGEDPLGKSVRLGSVGNQKEYTVTGVLADNPRNSSIRYDALIRLENLPDYPSLKDNWEAFGHRAFVKLTPKADAATLENRLKPFVARYFPASLESLKARGARPDERGDVFAIRLENIAKMHVGSVMQNGAQVALLYALMAIGFFILLIACFNFVNLSIARSFIRAREVGVRKTLGARKGQLFSQIWGEATLICLIGFVVGAMLAYMLLPVVNAKLDTRLVLDLVFQPGAVAVIVGMFVLVTTVAGGYPAWQMAKFNPVQVLKGKITLKRPGFVRNSLLVTQFAMATLLTCCTVVAIGQFDYLRHQPLGFEKEEVISIPVGKVGKPGDGRQILQRLRDRLAGDPAVLGITGSGVNIGEGLDHTTSRTNMGFLHKGKQYTTDWLLVDYDYLKTLRIKLRAGRDFSPAHPTDSTAGVIITESLAKKLGEKNPVGTLLDDDSDDVIIGVIPDVYLYALTDQTRPLALHISHAEPINYLLVRVAPGSLAASMEKMKAIMQEVAPGAEFLGSFLDQNMDQFYRDEEKIARIFGLSAGIAIVLSCLGLFAVALLVMEQRTKEIGIRKVLGASVSGIIFSLSRNFVKLGAVALLISLPLAWLVLQKWLENYPVRTELSVWVFAGIGAAALLTVLGTVSFQSTKAALANPVKSLRSE
jgi:ABC-type antimicrobial peptide transport system permease subunit